MSIDRGSLDAGPFGMWLTQFTSSLRGGRDNIVPCGDCVGCCASSHFIHIRPQDTEALRRIPRRMLAKAPGLPPGHKLLGYGTEGACPMLRESLCSIYEHRPRACRDYDCRVFAAAGLLASGPEDSAINQRVRRWRFSYPTRPDQQTHQAVKDAASFIQGQERHFPGARVPTAPGDVAVLAVKVHSVFLGHISQQTPQQVAAAIVRTSRDFGDVA